MLRPSAPKRWPSDTFALLVVAGVLTVTAGLVWLSAGTGPVLPLFILAVAVILAVVAAVKALRRRSPR